MNESTPTNRHAALRHLDRSGASISALCALHCALTPAVATLLPLVGLGLLADERAELAVMALSALVGAASLCLGARVHRSRLVAAVLLGGLTLLAAGWAAERGEFETIGSALAVVGGLGIASAHLLSRRLLLLTPAR